MPTHNRAKDETANGEALRVEARDGAVSVALGLSRAGLVRRSVARAVGSGRARSSSSSTAASAAAGQEAEAAAGGLRRKIVLPG
jgi:hypothetical protein